MAKRTHDGNTDGLESPESDSLNYYSIIIVVPPVVDDGGNIISLLQEIKEYQTFVYDLLDAVETYQTAGFSEVKVLDVADLNLCFAEEEDIAIYFKLIAKITSRMDNPLICMLGLGARTEEIIQDIVLAEETQEETGVEVALFNVDDPLGVWNDVTCNISYLVGVGATKYHIRNIIEHGHKGPLLGTMQILAPLLKEDKRLR